jgi:glutathione-specific gamma-glutamylcyclotransferase
MTEAAGSHWVFGYGSLMWRPGFSFIHTEPAALQGWHRSLCVFSHIYRGTAEKLGLVFGLDAGGQCHGMAFEVAPGVWRDTHAYLTERELVTNVYLETRVSVMLPKSGRNVSALTYVVDPAHAQYAGGLSQADTLAYVRQGHGEAGSCVDYVKNTAGHLAELGIPDPELDALVRLL